MEVTLCLTMLQPAPKKTHCLLPGIKPTSILRRHQHHNLGFVARTATSSPFLNCGLRAALDSRRVGHSIRASESTPPSSDGGNEFEKEVASLHDLLGEAMSMMKGMPVATKFDNEAAKSMELIKQWEKKEGSHEKYELGLSLIEILINRGEFNKANDVLQQLSPPTPIDGRLPLRKFIIDLSMQLQSLRDPRGHRWRQIVDTTKDNWEEYKQKYKLSHEPSSES